MKSLDCSRFVIWIFKSKSRLFLFFTLIEIPILVLVFPGLMIYDTGSSISQFYGYRTLASTLCSTPDNILTNHHPILFVFLFGGFVKLGELFGSQNLGILLYIVCQLALTNYTFVYCLMSINTEARCYKKKLLTTISLLVPIITLWTFTMSKDSLFSCCFLLFSTHLYNIGKSECEILNQFSFRVRLYVVVLLFMLTKNQGAFLILITAPVLLLIYKPKILKISTVLFSLSVFHIIVFCNIILPNCGVSQSGRQELLGFSFQQTARYVCKYSDTISSEEKDIINQIIPYDELPVLYNQSIQDPIKFKFNQAASNEDLMRYYILWSKMFISHPAVYLSATAKNCWGFFFDDRNYDPFPSFLGCSGELNHPIFKTHNPFRVLINRYKHLIGVVFSIPVISLILKPSFYVWFTIICFVLSFYRKRKHNIVALLPSLITIGVLVISPIVIFRYALPLVFTLPLVFSCCFDN